jgi:shikimate kinase
VPIPTIFEIEGEAGFRRRESQVINDLSQEPGLVLATGGGAVLDPQNRQCLHDRGVVIYLYAQPEVLFERTRMDRGRPLLQVEDRLTKLRELFAIRDPLYREVAHHIVEVGQTQASQVVRRILQVLDVR